MSVRLGQKVVSVFDGNQYDEAESILTVGNGILFWNKKSFALCLCVLLVPLVSPCSGLKKTLAN